MDMATLKELQNYAYYLAPHGKDEDGKNIWSVYAKEPSLGLNYMGDCVIMPKGYKFNGNVYKTVDDLFGGFKEWHKTLDLPSRFYDPLYNETYRLQGTIVWYLTDVLGFVADEKDFCNTYKRCFGTTVMRVQIEVSKDNEVSISYQYGKYQMFTTIKDYKEGFNFVNAYVTIVLAETVPMWGSLTGKLKHYDDNKMPTTVAADMTKGFLPMYEDGNRMILARLKELVRQLENNLNEKEQSITK